MATLQRTVTAAGKDAVFGTADEEIERILRVQTNYYLVLKVKKDTDPSEIRANQMRLSRLVHPDKCAHPKAADAASVVNTAADVLRTGVKKRVYDAYIDDTINADEGVTYAEWEAKQAVVRLPKWLEAVLRIPGVGLLVLLILFPLTICLLLILLVLAIVMWLLCLPLNCARACCCPPQAEGDAAPGGGAGEPHAAPPTQEATAV